jgi:hypothetical protein
LPDPPFCLCFHLNSSVLLLRATFVDRSCKSSKLNMLMYTFYFTFTVTWISKFKFKYTLCHVFPLCVTISRMRHHTFALKSFTVISCIMVLFWRLALSPSSRSVLLHLSGSCWFVHQSVDVILLCYSHTGQLDKSQVGQSTPPT